MPASRLASWVEDTYCPTVARPRHVQCMTGRWYITFRFGSKLPGSSPAFNLCRFLRIYYQHTGRTIAEAPTMREDATKLRKTSCAVAVLFFPEPWHPIFWLRYIRERVFSPSAFETWKAKSTPYQHLGCMPKSPKAGPRIPLWILNGLSKISANSFACALWVYRFVDLQWDLRKFQDSTFTPVYHY